MREWAPLFYIFYIYYFFKWDLWVNQCNKCETNLSSTPHCCNIQYLTLGQLMHQANLKHFSKTYVYPHVVTR